MDLINWIGIAVAVVIVVVGIIVYTWLRRKFENMNGFEGIVVERGKRARRKDFDWLKLKEEEFQKEVEEKQN